MKDRDTQTNMTVNLGMVTNFVLAVLKTTVGILGRSHALLADGINSTSDVIYYVAVKIFMHHARKPADAEHPYGHRQLETISAIVVGAFILTTGIAIFWESINKVYDLVASSEKGHAAASLALYIAGGTLITKIILYTYTKRSFAATRNPTLKALANDHFNDIMASIAVITGLIFGRMGYYWMDPAAGAVVAIYIIKTGVEIVMESSRELMDSVPDDDFHKEVRRIVLDVPGVIRIDDLGIHRFGPYYTVNMSIGVSGNISVEAGHEISHAVEEILLENYSSGLRNVHIHYHPAE
ncbi:MAG: cation diffusion facilitator family transporter [Candidatus Cloacimonadaceae bacterium]|nr:cation diffusion facilitator family transporter [Candidatus Cloacimonadaceae bacterium]MDP3114321.1 cation diffusion facilitator family transporter [Candidatus Cloacimonadaceae bacterium]